MTLILTGILLGSCVVLSCTSVGNARKSDSGKHLPDTLLRARWKESAVTVSAVPAGVVIKVYDPATHGYRVAGMAPAVVTWIHHCVSCSDPEPVAPVVLEYGGAQISVIPAGDRKGKAFSLEADFRGGEPVVRKGVLYDSEIVVQPERQADFPGGGKACEDFIMHALYYPAPARLKGIEGKVYASFVVEQDGSLTNLKVLRGIGGGCDEEVLDIIRMMPRWNPGAAGGKPVRTRRALEISFFLVNQNHVKSVYYWK
jgi:TonB family protein